MLKYQLVRVSKEEACIRGVLMLEWEPICVTMEPPWKNNKKNESCIPPGAYECFRRVAMANLTAGLPDTFEIDNVPGRDGILFHVGNFPVQTQGCVMLGLAFSTSLPAVPMITDSRLAFGRFWKSTNKENQINLLIVDICQRGMQGIWTAPTDGKNRGGKRLLGNKSSGTRAAGT
jgi:hypothetical protein